MTKEEKNRLIAEWLGIKLTGKEKVYGSRGEWYWQEWTKQPPDFYLSEEASAMVLEKLAEVAGTVELIRFDKWGVNPPRWSCGAPRTQSGEKDVRGPDRKTCIAEAAIVYIQAKEKR